MNRTLASGGWRGELTSATAHAGERIVALSPNVIMALIAGGLGYNALLAALVVRGFNIGETAVALTEFVLLLATAGALLSTGRRPGDSLAGALLAFFIVDALLISAASESLFLPMARNAAIMALFLMLGLRSTERGVRLAVAAASVLVGACLVLEVVSPSTYIATFEPSRYYEMTRGTEPLETLPGLFRNASGFGGRFSILQILDHRAASIFLEPVSLGNFGVVLLAFVLCFWKRLGRTERVAYPALIALTLVTTNSRLLFGFLLLSPIIYFVAPAIGRNARLLILPAIVAVATGIYLTWPDVVADDLIGRVGTTMRTLLAMDLAGLMGGEPAQAREFADSGYTFVIYASSMIGLVVLWLFVSLALPAATDLQKRLGLFVALYFFGNLLISGTSVFSIKVAALVWALIGYTSVTASTTDGNTSEGWRRSTQSPWRESTAPVL